MQYCSNLANNLNFDTVISLMASLPAVYTNQAGFGNEPKICQTATNTMHVLRNTDCRSTAHRNTNVEQIPIMYNFYNADGDYIGKMLDEFGLINMNGRCYDPVAGRFLSPDIIVQNPNNTQCYNRYSYCINNPLKYSDPSGWVPVGYNNWADRLNDLNHQIRNSSYAQFCGMLDVFKKMVLGEYLAIYGNPTKPKGGAMPNAGNSINNATIAYLFALKANYSSPIDITNYTPQQFSEAFLGVCAYERFFGDGIFQMNEYFTGSNDADFSFMGNVVMNRGDYEYNAYITANFKLTDEINLNNMEFHVPKILSMDLSGATIVPGGASIENQQQDILNFSLFCSVKFNDGIEYSAFNFYGGTLDNYARKSNPMLTNDGDRLIDGLTYRFDSSHIKQAKYYFNNFSSSFGYNWWYRY